jgi:hypothetical protein
MPSQHLRTSPRTYIDSRIQSIRNTQSSRSYQLAAINPQIDDDCSNLTAGEELCLGFKDQDCTTVHVVESGDFCEAIWEKTQTDETTFFANNPQVDDNCSNLYVGEVSSPFPPTEFWIDDSSRRLCARRRRSKFPTNLPHRRPRPSLRPSPHPSQRPCQPPSQPPSQRQLPPQSLPTTSRTIRPPTMPRTRTRAGTKISRFATKCK